MNCIFQIRIYDSGIIFVNVFLDSKGLVRNPSSIDLLNWSWVISEGRFSIVVPHKMLEYILHLCSLRDFDGIMRSLLNLLGSYINKLVFGIAISKVCLMEWLV